MQDTLTAGVGAVATPWGHPQVTAAALQATGTIVGALIVGFAGSWLTKRFARERDRQDRESQWRTHAIELTKLDMQRKLACRKEGDARPRPAILDFLANYRDLHELPARSPRDLYKAILEQRIASGEVAKEPPSSGEQLPPATRAEVSQGPGSTPP